MTTILAALDATDVARPVLEAALRIGEMTETRVEAIHVGSGPAETPELLAERAGVPFRLLRGPVEHHLLAAIGEPGVLAAVIGARTSPRARRPVGHVARHVLEHVDKPILVVPPELVTPGTLRNLLIPLEGTAVSSRPVLERLWPLLATDVEVIVLHVFTDTTLPAMLDHPARDLEILGDEFLNRHCPHATRIELRPGHVAEQVAEVSSQHDADLIVLSWSQDSSAGRARVIREVLGNSPIPVLLLPLVPSEVEGGPPHEITQPLLD